MIDAAMLVETYLSMKEYVPSKDRQAAADQLLSYLIDAGLNDEELEEIGSTDSFLKRAFDETVLGDDYLNGDDEDD
jgi:hypothetical protein